LYEEGKQSPFTTNLAESYFNGFNSNIKETCISKSNVPMIMQPRARPSTMAFRSNKYNPSKAPIINNFKPNTKTNKFNIKGNEENSEVLLINITPRPGVTLQLPLKRYDDILSITRSFFDENNIPERLLRPIVFKICEAMRNIFTTVNMKLKQIDRDYLFSLHVLYGKLKQEEAQEDTLSVIEKSFESGDLDISGFSAMSADEEDLPFFKLNKSY
jgi:hypothetical protein